MLINILLLLFVIGTVVFQMAQGLYSSAINMMLALFAAVIAFNFHEPLGGQIDRGSGYGEAIALVLLFAFSFSAMRILVDWRFGNDFTFHKWVDKPVAAALGLLTALIGGGVILAALQMLPLPAEMGEANSPQRTVVAGAPVADMHRFPLALGEPLDSPTNRGPAALAGGEQQFWLQPDRFTLSLFSLLSDTGLKGSVPFRQAHPDLPAELYARRCAPQYVGDTKDVRGFSRFLVEPEAVSIAAAQLDPEAAFFKDADTRNALLGRIDKGARLLLLDVRLSQQAHDEDGQIRFCGLQWMLRTAANLAKPDEPEQYAYRDCYPVGWSEPAAADSSLKPVTPFSPRDVCRSPLPEGRLLLLFALPAGHQACALQFKRSGLKAMPAPRAGSITSPGPAAPGTPST